MADPVRALLAPLALSAPLTALAPLALSAPLTLLAPLALLVTPTRLVPPTLLAALTAVFAPLPTAFAAELLELEVSKDGSRYHLLAEVYMDASPEAIFTVITDYDNLDRVSSAYKESGYLAPAPDGTPIVHTRMEGCLAFVCRSVRRVERLEARFPHHIRTIAMPEQSDVRYGRSLWRLEPQGQGTRIVYEIEMEPAFGVPPVVGPWLIKRSLRNGGARAVERIERLAREIELGGASSWDLSQHP